MWFAIIIFSVTDRLTSVPSHPMPSLVGHTVKSKEIYPYRQQLPFISKGNLRTHA